MSLRRSPLKRSRKPLPRVGRKAKRERAALDRFRREVRQLAGGWCEGYIHGICDHPIIHPGSSAHHIWPEDRDAGRHDPLRGAWLCATAHRWVHENPTSAAHMGLLRPNLDRHVQIDLPPGSSLDPAAIARRIAQQGPGRP